MNVRQKQNSLSTKPLPLTKKVIGNKNLTKTKKLLDILHRSLETQLPLPAPTIFLDTL